MTITAQSAIDAIAQIQATAISSRTKDLCGIVREFVIHYTPAAVPSSTVQTTADPQTATPVSAQSDAVSAMDELLAWGNSSVSKPVKRIGRYLTELENDLSEFRVKAVEHFAARLRAETETARVRLELAELREATAKP